MFSHVRPYLCNVNLLNLETMMTTSSSRIISDGDVVFARVSYMGATVLNVRVDNMDSIVSVVDWVIRQLAGLSGLVKISLRNASRGWTSDLYRTLGESVSIRAARG